MDPLEKLQKEIFELESDIRNKTSQINELQKHANTCVSLKALMLAGGDDVSCLVEIKLHAKSIGKTPLILTKNLATVFQKDSTKAMNEVKKLEKELVPMAKSLMELKVKEKELNPE